MKLRLKVIVVAAAAFLVGQAAKAQEIDIDAVYIPNLGTGWPHALLVSRVGSNLVEERDPASGVVLSTLTKGLNGPTGLTVSGKYLYVANSNGNNVTVYNTSLQLVSTLSAGIAAPAGVAVDAYGDVYVANTLAHNIVALRADGSIVESLGQDKNGAVFSSPGPLAIIGRLIFAGPVKVPPGVAVEGYNVGEFLTGDPTELLTIAKGLQLPTGIASDAAGDVYVSDYNGFANKYSPSGQALMTFLDPNGGFCRGIAVDSQTGNVYVSNGAPTNSISVFNADGALINTFH